MRGLSGLVALAAMCSMQGGALAQAYGGFTQSGATPAASPSVDANGFTVQQVSGHGSGDIGIDKYRSVIGSTKVFAQTQVFKEPSESGLSSDTMASGAYGGWTDGLVLASNNYDVNDPKSGYAFLKFSVSGSVATDNSYFGGSGNASFADAYFSFTATSGAASTTYRVDGHYSNSGYSNGAGITGLSVSKMVNGQPQLVQPGTPFLGDYIVQVAFTEGQGISLSAELGCSARVSIYATYNTAIETCDLAHSLTYGGITNITDGNGSGQQSAYMASSTSGFDYTRAYSEAAGTVPEPASWALMLIGFGAIGGALRGRRPVPAA